MQFKDQQEKSLQNIAAYFIDLKQFDSAYIYVNQLNKLLTKDSSPDLVMDMYNNRGLIYQAQNKLDSAKVELEIAVSLAIIHPTPVLSGLFFRKLHNQL